jgi:hypothetical protein
LDGRSLPVVRVHFGVPDGFTSVFPLAVWRFRDAAAVSAVCAKRDFVRCTALRWRVAVELERFAGSCNVKRGSALETAYGCVRGAKL